MNRISRIQLEAALLYAALILVAIAFFEYFMQQEFNLGLRVLAYVSAVVFTVFFAIKQSARLLSPALTKPGLTVLLVSFGVVLWSILLAAELMASANFFMNFDVNYLESESIFLSVLAQFMLAQLIALYASIIFVFAVWPILLLAGAAVTYYLYKRSSEYRLSSNP